jgi:allantoinase
MIATDHSPCPPEMKRAALGRFDLAWGGIASLSVALAAVWTGASEHGFSLDDIARWLSAAPATLAGLTSRVGALEAGRSANFTVFDPDAELLVTSDRLHTRHAISPYLGQRLRGVVIATYLRGEPVYRDGAFTSPTRGRELTLC